MQHIPNDIKLHQKSKLLEVVFDDQIFNLPCEYLRVFSPSAEVRGHAPGQETLQIGKEKVNIIAIEPVGQYAVKLIFDDAHNSGLYSWDFLYELGVNRLKNWQDYLGKLKDAGEQREPQANDKYLTS